MGQTTSSDLSPLTAPATHTNMSSLETEVNSTVGTAKQYVKAAQDALQSQGERVKGLAQGLAGTGGVQPTEQGQVLDVPAKSTPLEGRSHTTLGTAYPASTKTEIAQNEPGAPSS